MINKGNNYNLITANIKSLFSALKLVKVIVICRDTGVIHGY